MHISLRTSILCLLLTSSTRALTLDPGQSGIANDVGIGASGTLLASKSDIFVEHLSDALNTDTFVTSVTQTQNGQLVFTYTVSLGATDFITIPQSLVLSGFQGVSTEVYISTGPGSMNWAASRSPDGSSILFQAPQGFGNPFSSLFSVEIRTDAPGYVFHPTAFAPTYLVSTFLPPPFENFSYLQSFPTPAFAPNLSPVPEPLALLTLPLALAAMAVRFRRVS